MAGINLITATSDNYVIGNKGHIPWHLPADMASYRKITANSVLIMGRKTMESIGRILPGRHHIVVSSSPDYNFEGAQIVHSLDAALFEARTTGQPIFINGGEEIYRQALSSGQVDTIYMTRVHGVIEGDAFFPYEYLKDFSVVEEKFREADAKNEYDLTFVKLSRKQASSQY